MSTAKDPVVRQTEKTADSASAELEERAFQIFRDRSASGRLRTRTAEQTARESFQLALAFQQVRDSVRDGSVSLEPEQVRPPQKVKVPRMRAKSDTTPAVFEPVMDENRRPIIDEVLADNYAYCPNCPPEHPANARFVPLDGKTREQHISETRMQLAGLN